MDSRGEGGLGGETKNGGAGGSNAGSGAATQLDLLFVVDNSSMNEGEQESLAKAIPNFLAKLKAFAGGVDIHAAVVTTDVGAGMAPGCTSGPFGDRGAFMNASPCGVKTDAFARIGPDGKGKNFEALASTVVSCLVKVGSKGCGYEQPLRAAELAFEDRANPGLAGFRRPGARLGLLIVTTEDDCSAKDPDLFYGAPTPTGQAPSLRCSRAGHACGGALVPGTTFNVPLASCTAVADKALELLNIDEVRSRFQLAAGAGVLRMAVLAGWPANDSAARYEIADRGMGLDLQPACTSASGSATPAIRLREFALKAGKTGHFESLCADDWAAPLERVAQFMLD